MPTYRRLIAESPGQFFRKCFDGFDHKRVPDLKHVERPAVFEALAFAPVQRENGLRFRLEVIVVAFMAAK